MKIANSALALLIATLIPTHAVFAGEQNRFSYSESSPMLDGDGVSHSDVIDVIRANESQFDPCYRHSLLKKSNWQGTIPVRFMIDLKGKVSSTELVGKQTADSNLQTCVASIVKRWTFTPPRRGRPVEVEYAFGFSSLPPSNPNRNFTGTSRLGLSLSPNRSSLSEGRPNEGMSGGVSNAKMFGLDDPEDSKIQATFPPKLIRVGLTDYGPGLSRVTLSHDGLSQADIAAVISDNYQLISSCYEHYLKAHPNVGGFVRMSYKINLSGQVVGPLGNEIRFPDSIVEECLKKTLVNIRFPTPRNGRVIEVSQSFSFSADPWSRKVDRTMISGAGITRGITKEKFESIANSTDEKFAKCYEEFLAKVPRETGDFDTTFEISLEGEVVNLKTSDKDVLADGMKDCIFSVMLGWQFPKPTSPKPVKASYNFQFRSN